MARMIRWHEKEFVHFVTNRTEHEMFFLNPTKKVNDLILFWLAKAKEKRGKNIRLFAFVFMSNHFHFLLQDPEGELAEFMGYFQGNLAKALNKVHGRHGRFWSREYNDVIVDGENEFWDRYKYTAANPIAAGLVDKPEEWGGVNSVPYVKNNISVTGIGTNVTKYNNACRHNRTADKKDFEEEFCFSLSAPPMQQPCTSQNNVFLMSIIADAGRTAYQARRKTTGMGMNAVLSQSPYDRPKSPARSVRFKIMSFCEERGKELKDAYKQFVGSYRACCQHLIQYFEKAPTQKDMNTDSHEKAFVHYLERAPTILWPPGCYVPTRHTPVAV